MLRTMKSSPRSSYHHGELRTALVDTALELLAQKGSFAFSLRDVARRAGVSHAAPYKHFASKLELMAEVSSKGFDMLTTEMSRAAAECTAPQQKLEALGSAYVAFGLKHPALYMMMFGPDVAESEERGIQYRFQACFRLLLAVLEEAADASLISREEVDAVAMLAWAQVHGMTRLLQDEKIRLSPQQLHGVMRLSSVLLLPGRS